MALGVGGFGERPGDRVFVPSKGTLLCCSIVEERDEVRAREVAIVWMGEAVAKLERVVELDLDATRIHPHRLAVPHDEVAEVPVGDEAQERVRGAVFG